MSSAAASSSSASMPSMKDWRTFVAELDEHVAFDFGLDEIPDHLALRGRQRFDQQRDLGRMHGGDHARGATPRTFAQRAAQGGEAAFFGGRAVASMTRRSVRKGTFRIIRKWGQVSPGTSGHSLVSETCPHFLIIRNVPFLSQATELPDSVGALVERRRARDRAHFAERIVADGRRPGSSATDARRCARRDTPNGDARRCSRWRW